MRRFSNAMGWPTTNVTSGISAFGSPLQGLAIGAGFPGALPQAGMGRPVGASKARGELSDGNRRAASGTALLCRELQHSVDRLDSVDENGR